jgi:uncharacterized membrane protein YkoI
MNKQMIQKHYVRMVAKLACVAVAAAIVGCESESGEGHEHKQAKLMSQAKISEADARATALSKVPDGTIKESELEKEKGKLIWSFDISRPGTRDISEVNVDAITGEVVGMELETPKDQAKEKDEEKSEKKDKD